MADLKKGMSAVQYVKDLMHPPRHPSDYIYKASDAFAPYADKNIVVGVTQADRTIAQPSGRLKGGPLFSMLGEVDPAYKGKTWGFDSSGHAQGMLNAFDAQPADTMLMTTILGGPLMQGSNSEIFKRTSKAYRDAIANNKLLPDHLRKTNELVQKMTDKKGGVNLFDPDSDVTDPAFWKGLSTFQQRRAMNDIMGGIGVGGPKSGGAIFDWQKIMDKTTEPMLRDVPTRSVGPRIWTLDGGKEYSPHLNKAYPDIVTGVDQNINFNPVPYQDFLKDFTDNFMQTKNRVPNWKNLTMGHPKTQEITDQWLQHLKNQGYADGGQVEHMQAGGIKKGFNAIDEIINAAKNTTRIAPENEVADLLGRVANSAGMKAPVTARKPLTGLQDFHTSLGDRINERVREKQDLADSMTFRYQPNQFVHSQHTLDKNLPPHQILQPLPFRRMVMREDKPFLGMKGEDGKQMYHPYEPGYRIRHELSPDEWHEYQLPESALIKPVDDFAQGGRVEHMQHGGIMPRAGIYYPTSNDERNQAAGLPADFYRKGMTDVASHGYHAGVDVPAGDARLTADLMGSRYVSPQMNKDSINALRLGAEFSVGDGRLRAELMKGLAPNVPTNVGLRYSRPFAEGGSVEHMQAGGIKKGLGVLEDVANSLLKPKPALSPYQLANQKAPLFGQSADPYARSLQQGFEHGWSHGTTGDITSFDRALLGETTGANSAKKGFFFARDPQNPPESLKYKTTDPDSIEMLRKAGVDVDKFNKVSFEGHGADTAADYSRMGGDREYKEAMRNANAAEARRDWPEQERWMQIAEDHEISRMNRDQGLVAKHGEARDVMLEKIRDSFYGTMAGKSQNELSAFNRQYEKMFPENWWNSPFSGQVDDIKSKVVSHLGEENAAPVLDAIKQWQSVGADRIIADHLQSGSNVIPAALRYKNPLVHDFQGNTYRDQTYSDLVDQALKNNHDALILKNTYDPGAGTSKLIDVGVVFDPKNIRSKFAAFDPEHIDSADISKAEGGKVEHMQAGGLKKAGSFFLSELDNAIAGVGTAGRTPIVPVPNRWFLQPDKHPHQQGMVERVLERTGRPRESFTSGAFIDPRTGEVLDSKILEDVGVVINPRTNRPAMSAGKEAGVEQLDKELGLITESNLVRNNIFRRTGGDPMLDDLAFLATIERSGMGHKYGLSTEYGSPVLLNNKMTKDQPSLRPKSRGDVFGMGDVVGQIEIKKGMPHDVYEKLFVAPEGMDVQGVRLHKAEGGRVEHMQSGGLKTLFGEILNKGGTYAARRLERAADEIPNLEKLFQAEALKSAFLGDNARAVMTIKPSEFEKYAAPLSKTDLLHRTYRPYELTNEGVGFKRGEELNYDDYIKSLIGVQKNLGFESVPFLEVNKKLQGSTGLPFISGHEGRHRNRAMDQSGEQASLVQFLPRSELREPFERRYQDQYIDAIRKEMALTGNRVKPQTYNENVLDSADRVVEIKHNFERPAIDLPDLYAEGGVAHKQVGGAMGLLERLLGQKAANTAAKAPKALTPLERRYALDQFKAGSADPRQFYHGSRHYYLDDATSKPVIAPDEGIRNLQTPSQLKNWNYQNNADAVFLTPESSFSNAFAGDIKDAQARPAVYPVHAQVKNPFDIHNQEHANALIEEYKRLHIAPDDAEKLGRFKKDVAFAQRDPANWATLENTRVQDAIKSLGHDSFYVTENGVKNLGVYNPNLIKSSLGNRGTFDINEADMGKAEGGAVHSQAEDGDIMRQLFDHALDKGDIHEMTHAMLVKQHEAEYG